MLAESLEMSSAPFTASSSTTISDSNISSSFRDPDGTLFWKGGVLHRGVRKSYADDLALLDSSGLLKTLWDRGLLVRHTESEPSDQYCAVLLPELIPFISYPQEWSFSQLKDAALLTLEIEELALSHGMTLKDASAFNVQFIGSRPIFIDTLSFERYESGTAWKAYRQFCQHFLAPLALMSKCDVRLSKLSQDFIDGVPLDLASSILGGWSLKFGLMLHLHMHAKSQTKHADDAKAVKPRAISLNARRGLIDSLRGTIQSMRWKPQGTEWGDYYQATNYSGRAFSEKERLVQEFLSATSPKKVYDLGANEGVFSRIASDMGAYTLSFDIDPAAVEKHYLRLKNEKNLSTLPLLQDLTNPTPNYGWAGTERSSLLARGEADTAMALALVHHLAISNNLPLEMIAQFFARAAKNLIIEFVPKSDSQVKRLLATREDIFPSYTESGFENAFSGMFKIVRKENVPGSERTMYLMVRK